MMTTILTASLWTATLSAGLMAGVFFAFSSFIMNALGERPPDEGLAAMRSINRVILRSSFLPLFTFSSGLSLLLGGWAVWAWQSAAALPTLAGSLTYLLGMFACTGIFNVPLNEGLERAPAGEEATRFWKRYLKVWTRYNHSRTLASILSCGFFMAALLAS
ncbi:MAG: anthrone oxygenase family protein [Myxococcota bacterium]